MKPTIKNIAKAAGVSTATVSRALANKDNLIRPETSARVRKIAQQMGYHKNVAASQLASNITKTIAVIINYTQTDFWQTILDGILKRAHERGHKVIIFSAGEHDPQRLNETINEALEHQATGILLISGRIDHQQVNTLSNAHTPYRLISIYNLRHPEHRFISSDDVKIGIEATDYLLQRGHTKIGLVGIDHSSTGQQRLFGFQKAMTNAGLIIDPGWIHYGNYSYENGKELFQEIQGRGLTAVVAGSDMIAAGLIKEAARNGVKVPDQLSIIGIDGSIIDEIVTPELTTVSQDFFKMGTASVDNLLDDDQSLFIPTKIFESAIVKDIN